MSRLRGDGQQSICVGTVGGEIHVFSPDGELEMFVPLGNHFRRRKDAYFGWVYSIHSLQVWSRESDGRAALVAGGYAIIVFLNADGEIVGHSWADGSWQTDILVDRSGSAREGDLWVRCGWVHGIFVYDGTPGTVPSGATVAFGGVKQPMFRALGKVIPFVTGPTLAFEWCGAEAQQPDRILAASDLGIGLLSTETRDWIWKHEGGTQFTACMALKHFGDNLPVIMTGEAGGFVSTFSQADGKPLRRLHLGTRIVGLVDFPERELVVAATDHDLVVLDRSWRVRFLYPVAVRQLRRFGNAGAVIIADAESKLHVLALD